MTAALRGPGEIRQGSRLSRRLFLSLGVPNYRRYFAGQIVSLSGNWIQIVAETWLILTLTHSGLAVGVTTALQFAPILLFGAFGGLLADRFDKRRLLMVTQVAMVVPAVALWALAASGAVEPWMVFALVFARGAVNAVDNPTRQSFVIEMVGPERVVNAVSLNSVIVHSARMVGPAIAGVLIATVGVEVCFLLNALTFPVMVMALRRMDPGQLVRPHPVGREAGALRAALRYVAATPALAIPLAMMALVSTLAFNFQVLLPLLARFTFDGGPESYAALVCAMGGGSVVGALVAGARGRASPAMLIGSSAAFGTFTLLAAAAPTLPLAVAALVLVGAASVTFAAGVNSTLQLEVEPAMRGRVMALYSVVFLGATPIGAPLAGWLAQTAGPRAGLLLGAAAALLAASLALAALRRRPGHVRDPAEGDERRAPPGSVLAGRLLSEVLHDQHAEPRPNLRVGRLPTEHVRARGGRHRSHAPGQVDIRSEEGEHAAAEAAAHHPRPRRAGLVEPVDGALHRGG
ncbi:MFS transporter [soil metagenome]